MRKNKLPLFFAVTLSVASLIAISASAQPSRDEYRRRHVHASFGGGGNFIIGETLFKNIYRSYAVGKNDHFYSQDRNEGPRAGYIDEYAGSFMSSLKMNSLFDAPLLGCYMGQGMNMRHSLALNDCRGQGYQERTLGFLSTKPSTGLLPLHRYVNLRTGDMVAVIDPASEVLAGYNYQGIIGYAIPMDPRLSDRAMQESQTRCVLQTIPAEAAIGNFGSMQYTGLGRTQSEASANAERSCLANERIRQLCLVELGATLICQ